MTNILVRAASLDDTHAITTMHVVDVPRWQRLTKAGAVEDVVYDDLSLFERWQYGGPWLSVETCAVHLTHVLRGAGITVLAEIDKDVAGYAEFFIGEEPRPWGRHLHIGSLVVAADFAGHGVEKALLDHAAKLANDAECKLVTLNSTIEIEPFMSGYEMEQLVQGTQVAWPARTGQTFYQASPHEDDNPNQIRGWAMPFGRHHSAHYQWVTGWSDLWAGVPGLRERRIERLKFNAAGGNFFVMYAASPYDPRRASVSMWTEKPVTVPVLTAINDKAHKLGFRRLDALIMGDNFAFLGNEAESEGRAHDVFGITLA